MKTLLEINETRVPVVRIDTSLNKYQHIVLFPEKLALANAQLAKSGFPGILEPSNDKRNQDALSLNRQKMEK